MAITKDEANNLHHFMLHAQAKSLAAQSRALLEVVKDQSFRTKYITAGGTSVSWDAQMLAMVTQAEVLQRAAISILDDVAK